MEKKIREERLKMLVGHLLTKYDLSYHSVSHICFNIKPKDVIDIVTNWKDVLDDSNLYISPATQSHSSYSTTNFEAYVGENWFGIKSKVYDSNNHFEVTERMLDVEKIEIDIGSNSILSFQFNYKGIEQYSQYSFRND